MAENLAEYFAEQLAEHLVNDGSRSFKEFWDLVACYIMEFAVRLVTGDFNMALWFAVVELRARGFQANLAAWCPWKKSDEAKIRMDSCAIIVIGPAVGLRRMYDPSVLSEGILASELPENWSNMQEIVRDDDGKEKERRPWEVPIFNYDGQGYALKNYRPPAEDRKNNSLTGLSRQPSSRMTPRWRR